jgi:hypothetical protein
MNQVRLEIFVGARIGHCGLCYGRWEEVRRESLLPYVICVVVVVSRRRHIWQRPIKVCSPLHNVSLSLKRLSGNMCDSLLRMFKLDGVCLSPARTSPKMDCFSALFGVSDWLQSQAISSAVCHLGKITAVPSLLSRSLTLVPSSRLSTEVCRCVPLRTRGRSKMKVAILHPSFDMLCVFWGKPRVLLAVESKVH